MTDPKLSPAEQARREVEEWWRVNKLVPLLGAYYSDDPHVLADLIARLTPVYAQAQAMDSCRESYNLRVSLCDDLTRERDALRERAERAEATAQVNANFHLAASTRAGAAEADAKRLREALYASAARLHALRCPSARPFAGAHLSECTHPDCRSSAEALAATERKGEG